MMMLRAFTILSLLGSLSAPSAWGQISSATLTGTVKDATGAVVPGTTVEVRNRGTNLTRTTRTGSGGEYVLSDLPGAQYQLRATANGFKVYVQPSLDLQVGQHATVDIRLEVGSVDQEVTVTASAPLLNAVTSSVGQVVNTSTMERMPLNGRSFWQLTQLTPGVVSAPAAQGTTGNGRAIRASSVNVSINGTSQIYTGWSLDGASIVEAQLGGTLIQPNVDAIQEFKVESANMAAEYGHTPTMVNASLRSGSNALHGSLFEFVRNDKLDARNFFYVPPPGSKLVNEPLRRNQYGFTLGGPIRQNRTFFFADVEQTNLRQGLDYNNVVPSQAMRGGDFSELLRGARPVNLTDPLNPGTVFPNNRIPASSLSPQGQFFLKYLPEANVLQGATSRASLTNNLGIDTTKGDIRLDHQLGASDSLMGRYSISDNSESDPNAFPALGRPGLHSRAQNAVISETHIFGPSWINNARVSYYRSIFLFGPILGGQDTNQLAGVKGMSGLTSIYGFPSINMAGFAGFAGSPSDSRPKSNRIRDFVYADTMSYSKGKHDVKFGAELTHQTLAFFNGGNSVGTFNFQGTYSGNSFAEFLLGYPNNVSRAQYQNLFGLTGNFWSFFVQDNYRLTPNITVNVGARWEINPFYDGIRGQKTGFDPLNGKLVVPSNADPTAQLFAAPQFEAYRDRIAFTGDIGLPNSVQRKSKRDFAPRLGLAWHPAGHPGWVMRVAYGLFYVFPDGNTLNNTGNSTPFVATQTVFNDPAPAVPTRTWADFFQGQPIVTPNPRPGQRCDFGFVANSCATPDLSAGALTMRSTYLQQWNVSVQRQISASTALDLAYVGNKTTHLNLFTTINDPAPGAGAIQTRRPYPQWGGIRYSVFDGNANYNGLQAKIETRSWHGLNLLASYAYSKCIDPGSSQGGTTTLLVRLNRGVCDYDLPHLFAGSFAYQLPFGKGRLLFGGLQGWRQHLIGGWEFAGIVTERSGLPFSPGVSGDPANTGVSSRADLIGKPVLPRTVDCWFYTSANSACANLVPNTADAFAVPPARLRYGTAGRNILRGDVLNQVDFTVIKTIQVTESKRVEFRGELFNILNHASFAVPSTAVNSSSGGQVGATANAARVIQLALKFYF